jgi:hypothetical protein
VRTVVMAPPSAPAAPPVPEAIEIEAIKPSVGPATRLRGKTAPSDPPAQQPGKKPKTKLVVTFKIKSPALKKALEKRNMIKK